MSTHILNKIFFFEKVEDSLPYAFKRAQGLELQKGYNQVVAWGQEEKKENREREEGRIVLKLHDPKL